MQPNQDIAAILTLVVYAAIAVACVAWQVRRKAGRLGLWLLYTVEKIYAPFFFHWRANRRCPFPDDGSAIILANHRSPVDPVFVWAQHHLSGPSGRVRPISFMTAKEYFDVPGVGWICRTLNSIPVSRNGADMAPVREALRRLQNDELIGVFPEGRINRGEGLLPGNPGIAWLALTSKVPVYPVFVHDAPQGRSMIEPFCTPTRVRVSYGDPIDLSAYYGQRKTRELLQEVTDFMMARLGQLGGLDDFTKENEPPTLSITRATG